MIPFYGIIIPCAWGCKMRLESKIYFRTNIMREIIMFSVFLVFILGFIIVEVSTMKEQIIMKNKQIAVLGEQLRSSEFKRQDVEIELSKIEKLEAKGRFKNEIYDNVSGEFGSILDVVYDKSSKYGVDPYTILGIIKAESNYDRKALSTTKTGKPIAYGLMQINLSVWRGSMGLDEGMIYNIPYNIEAGIKIFKYYLGRAKGDVNKALFFYNNGEGGVYNNRKYSPKVSAFAIGYKTR